jgi:TetR/AcrR family transcriptional regulator
MCPVKVVQVVVEMVKKKSAARPSTLVMRRSIIDAALTVFSASGYEGASTRAIAAVAGLELGHLTYYFKSKEMLWREVVTTFTASTNALLDESLAGADLRNPIGVANIVLPKVLRQIAQNHRLARLMLQDFSVASSRHDRLVWDVGRPVWLRLRPLFEALQRSSGSKIDASLHYYAMMGSALVFFGSSPEVREITGIDATNASIIEDYIALIVRSAVGSESRTRSSGRQRR